jgi:hypothetical protein
MSDLTIEEQENIGKNKRILDNAITLSNVTELAVSVILRVAGKDIADSIDKQSLNRAVLTNLVANRIKEKVLVKGQTNA